jgi:peptide/nickel transport system ATP-binding protein
VPLFQPAPTQLQTRPEGAGSLLSVKNLSVAYGGRRGLLGIGRAAGTQVVHDVSFSISRDETFALIGESGSGKTTIARAICGLAPPEAGVIAYQGAPLAPTTDVRLPDQRREIQYVFQNPDASLNPRMRIAEILARPLDVFFGEKGRGVRPKVERALADVRLDLAYLDRFPQELSGGERQRVAIARALLAQPSLLLCDEVLSGLDVSVQARVLELLRELRKRTGVSMLFISHDLGVVRSLADRVGVLFRGQLVEVSATEEIYMRPRHPYTQRLLSAAVNHDGPPPVSPDRALHLNASS